MVKKQDGFAHIIAIVVGVVVVGAVGFVAWNAFSKNSAENAVNDAVSSAVKAECEKKNDRDICKFVSNWKMSEKYRMVAKDQNGTETLFEIDGDKTRMKL